MEADCVCLPNQISDYEVQIYNLFFIFVKKIISVSYAPELQVLPLVYQNLVSTNAKTSSLNLYIKTYLWP